MTHFFSIGALVMSTTTLFGLLFHDMHLDKATSIALGVPTIAVAGTVAADALLKKSNPHVHVHSTEAPRKHSIRSMPTLQNPRDENRKQTPRRAHLHFGADNGIIWPSV